MKKGQITKIQTDTLSYMLQFTKKEGRKPTYREISAHFGLVSPASSFQRVKAMERALGICPWCQQKIDV